MLSQVRCPITRLYVNDVNVNTELILARRSSPFMRKNNMQNKNRIRINRADIRKLSLLSSVLSSFIMKSIASSNALLPGPCWSDCFNIFCGLYRPDELSYDYSMPAQLYQVHRKRILNIRDTERIQQPDWAHDTMGERMSSECFPVGESGFLLTTHRHCFNYLCEKDILNAEPRWKEDKNH